MMQDLEDADLVIPMKGVERIDPVLQDSPPLISIASFFGSVRCFKFLLLCEASLSHQDSVGRYPVHFASSGGNSVIWDLLDSAGADFSVCDAHNMNCFHYACKYGNIDLLNRLWLRGHDLNAFAFDGQIGRKQAIHFACEFGHSEVVQFLIEKGANFRDEKIIDLNFIENVVSIALRHKHIDVIRILARNEVDTTFFVEDDLTPLLFAALNDETRVVEALLENPKENVNQSERNGWTSLHFAVTNNNKKLVESLLKSGAKVNAASKWRMTPTHIALNRKHLEIAELLIQRGGVSFLE